MYMYVWRTIPPKSVEGSMQIFTLVLTNVNDVSDRRATI